MTPAPKGSTKAIYSYLMQVTFTDTTGNGVGTSTPTAAPVDPGETGNQAPTGGVVGGNADTGGFEGGAVAGTAIGAAVGGILIGALVTVVSVYSKKARQEYQIITRRQMC
jgi:hypothetical protein